MSSTEKNKELTRRWFEEVWNQRRSEAIDRLLAPDGIAYGLDAPGTPPKPGPESFRPFWEKFCGAFPDLRIIVEEVIGEGDMTAARFSFQGTHRGDHLGAPATGRPILATGMCLIRWRNGQIVQGWNEFDSMRLFQQIGATGK